MPKFITHKVEIPFTAKSMGDKTTIESVIKGEKMRSSRDKEGQPNHLMEGKAAIDRAVQRMKGGHISVHVLVHEPESYCFVSNKRLVVRFSIGNCFFLEEGMVHSDTEERREKKGERRKEKFICRPGACGWSK